MKHLKYFEQASAYEAYKNRSDYVLPNVSYVADTKEIWYDPFVEAKPGVIMAHYRATEENKVALGFTDNVKSLKVNGTEVDYWDPLYYSFDEVGEYDVEIELIDPTRINDHMFYFWDEGIGACLTSIVIPDSVTNLGEGAFYDCSSLTSVVIPDSVTEIGPNAFNDCSGLTSIVIPNSITNILSGTFAGCSGLTSVVIPDSVTFVSNDAFANCSGLNEVTCNAITAPMINYSTFYNVKKGGVLKVPAGSDYSSWMSTNYDDCGHLSTYNWTIEYI